MKIIQLYILLLSSFRFLVTSGTWQTEEFVFELNKDQKVKKTRPASLANKSHWLAANHLFDGGWLFRRQYLLTSCMSYNWLWIGKTTICTFLQRGICNTAMYQQRIFLKMLLSTEGDKVNYVIDSGVIGIVWFIIRSGIVACSDMHQEEKDVSVWRFRWTLEVLRKAWKRPWC